METTITRKGQVTIPKHIRDSLRLAPGSKLVFDVNAAGELFCAKANERSHVVRTVSTALWVRGR